MGRGVCHKTISDILLAHEIEVQCLPFLQSKRISDKRALLKTSLFVSANILASDQSKQLALNTAQSAFLVNLCVG